MAVRTFVCTALCVFLALAAGAAHAEPKNADTVAILAVKVTNEVAQIVAQAQELLATSLQSQGIRLIKHEDVSAALKDKPELAECQERACAGQIRKLVNAGRLVSLEVRRESGLYSFTIVLVGQAETKTEGSCAVCTTGEFSGQVAGAVVELLSSHPAKPMAETITVEIHTIPASAQLAIDGKDIGISPYRGELKPGPHTIRASHPGYESAEKQVEVGEDEEVKRVDMELMSDLSGGETPGQRYRTLKWLGTGVTAAALTTGIVWLSVSGNGTCSGNATCPEVYNTTGQGLGAIGVGVLAGAATVWMFLQDRDSAKGTHLSVEPTRGGVAGALTLEF